MTTQINYMQCLSYGTLFAIDGLLELTVFETKLSVLISILHKIKSIMHCSQRIIQYLLRI